MKTSTIQTTYYDAIYFASATINEYEKFHITSAELRLLLKLIHYSTNQENITWSSENISKHIFTSATSIDKSIQRLKQKGYINVSTTQRFEKVKSRTIFINWEMIEKVNKLAADYTTTGEETNNGLATNDKKINKAELNDLKNENYSVEPLPVSTEIIPQIEPIQVNEDIKVKDVTEPTLSTKRIELIPAIKAGAKKYYTKRKDDEHYDKQIKDLCDFYNECEIKYLDELTDSIKENIKLELVDGDGYFYKVPLFKSA